MSSNPKNKAQSKDFLEIRNTHTNMNIEKLSWDRIFHNWNDPENCAGRKRPDGCEICNKILNNENIESWRPNK